MAYDPNSLATLGVVRDLAVKVKEIDKPVSIPKNISAFNNDVGYQTADDVASAIAATPHLSYKKVASVGSINLTAANADRYIYMVPTTDGEGNNLYDEYMIIDGTLEHIGNTKIDLSNYVQKEVGKGLSTNDFTNEDKEKLDGIDTLLESKQDKLTGSAGQIVGFDNSGNATAVDFNGASSSLENVYSYNEVKIGKWLDKDLYRIVVQKTLKNASFVVYEPLYTNSSVNVIFVKTLAYTTAGYNGNLPMYIGEDAYCSLYWDNSTIYYSTGGANFANATVYLVIEYTKK